MGTFASAMHTVHKMQPKSQSFYLIPELGDNISKTIPFPFFNILSMNLKMILVIVLNFDSKTILFGLFGLYGLYVIKVSNPALFIILLECTNIDSPVMITLAIQ